MWPDHCVQGSDGAKFHAKCQPNESDIIVSKGMDRTVNSYSGFGEAPEVTSLLTDLRKKKVTTLYCVGLAYDYCVGLTAVDGANNGFKTYIVMDGTCSVKDDTAAAMKKTLADSGVKEITSE